MTRIESVSDSMLSRIGRICQRDRSVLPITDEEFLIARGLDLAITPPANDLFPTKGTEEEKKAWDLRMNSRTRLVFDNLVSENWDFFKEEAEKIKDYKVPLVAVFGKVVVADTSFPGIAIGKMLELAVEKTGLADGVGLILNFDDPRANLGEGNVLTVIRHWMANNSETIKDLFRNSQITGGVGPENLQTFKKESGYSGDEFVNLVCRVLEVLNGEELMGGYKGVNKIVVCGDPNSGKSVFAYELVNILNSLGVKSIRLDLDLGSPTTNDFLDKTKRLISDLGKTEDFEEILGIDGGLKRIKKERQENKIEWTEELGEMARDQLAKVGEEAIAIADIGGGIPTNGDRWGPRAYPLEVANGVIIVSRDLEGVEEWRKVIGNMEKPPVILAEYISQLEGLGDFDEEDEKIGRISSLRRESSSMYNPIVMLTALMLARNFLRNSN